jgi:DNA-binding MarR family transcriptional regulator
MEGHTSRATAEGTAGGGQPEAETIGGEAAERIGAETAAFRAVGFMLSSLGHAIAVTFSARLAPLGLEPREFALLRSVAAHEGASQQAIGEKLGIPPSRMVAIVDTLEGRSLVERRASPNDRRAHALYLTNAGKQLLAEAVAVAVGFESELTHELDVDQRNLLLQMLDHVADALGVPPGVHAAQIYGGAPPSAQ